MLPSERRDVLDHVGRRGDAFTVKLGESEFEIERIPIDDGVDKQVQPGRPVGVGTRTVPSDTLRSNGA